MFEFLALITNKRYWRLHSKIVAAILRLYGARVGRNFYIEGTPRLKIRGRAEDIQIGDDVSVFGDIDLRNRENGRIIIEDGVAIDTNCRFVAANDAVLRIGRGSSIGSYCIFNSGASITLGRECLLAGMIVVQSSEHGFKKGEPIMRQKHTYGAISIGDDVWIAANAMIAKGVEIGNGCVVGAKSLVRAGRYEPFSVLAGTPAKKIKERA